MIKIMENLDKALEGKTLKDLEETKAGGGSNLIEPTETEIGLILAALKGGMSHSDIKKTIRRNSNGAKLGFSFDQIKEIDAARLAKIAELTPPAQP
jgi:hypothetical protein